MRTVRHWALCIVGSLLLFVHPSFAASKGSIHSGGPVPRDGMHSDAFILGPGGSFFGTTAYGGRSTALCPAGCGTVYKISSGGKWSLLHTFSGDRDGRLPLASKLRAAGDGALYGVTTSSVYKITTEGKFVVLWSTADTGDIMSRALMVADDGTLRGASCCRVLQWTPQTGLTRLHTFDPPQGARNVISLTQTTDGDVYGATTIGGPESDHCRQGCGTLFRISAQGAFETLHQFTGGSDGRSPGGLVDGSDGELYGTTYLGGDGGVGHGTVFKISTSGTLTTLHAFASQQDGALPTALVVGRGGGVYGMTIDGGGTVFNFDARGAFTTLQQFTATNPDGSGGDSEGAGPTALIEGRDGSLYGATVTGACANAHEGGCGTVFKLDGSGTLTTLHAFNGRAEGHGPAALVEGPHGDFYGTTLSGGVTRPLCASGCGTVFKITRDGKVSTLHRFGSDK